MAVQKTLLGSIPSTAATWAECRGDCDVSYGSTTGPFAVIDVHGDVADGRGNQIFVNRTTMNQLAEVFGFLSPEDVVKLHGELEQQRVKIAELEDELAVQRADKVVPLAEVIDFVRERERRRPTEAA